MLRIKNIDIKNSVKSNKRIAILHLIYGLQIGGAEIALFHYINALGFKKYKHYVCCYGTDGPVRKKIESLGVQVIIGKNRESIKHPVKFLVTSFSLMINLISLIRKNHIDIIHSHSTQANQLGVIFGQITRRPSFPTVHSTMAFVDKRKDTDIAVRLNNIINWFTYRFAAQVLCVSNEIKSIVTKKFKINESNVSVLKNGIVFDCVRQNTNLGDEFVDHKERFKIIAVGRLVPLKSFDILIRAIAQVITKGNNDIIVHIAGDGEERKKLEKLIKELSVETYIKLLGERSDVISLMKRSDLFIIPSKFEGLSIAMIEAMACGLPVIASDSPGLGVFIDDGYNGRLFPMANVDYLAELIINLMKDRKNLKKLSINARATFEQEYDMNQNIKSLKSLFQKYSN
jgi:glycosyltransferase involved in cell wall biosynthesis